MAFETEFLELMPHTVTITPYVSHDKYGEPSFGTPKPYRCRIVGKGLSLRTGQEEELTSIYTVYMDAGNDVITTRDRLTLPADNAFTGPAGSTTPFIFTVTKQTDEQGHHHTVINCGWMYHRQGQR